MDDDFDGTRAVKWFTAQLEPYASSVDSYGQVCADIADISEACHWFLTQFDARRSKILSQEDLEDALIDIDVKFVQHVSFHLNSLSAELHRMLEKFPNGEGQ
jgi:hypothetical protein